MKRILLSAFAFLALSSVAAHAASPQVAPVPTCQYMPSANQGGVNGSCGEQLGFWDGAKFQVVDSTHPLPAGGTVSGTVTANQGTQNAGGALAWFVRLLGLDNATVASATNPVPTTVYDSNGTQNNFTLPALIISTSQYPNGSTPITGNATGTTGAVVGTLAGTSGKTTYICGFDVSAIGGVATIGPITVAGLKGSSAVYQLASTATGVTMARSFSPCIPASASNTPITITTTADGTATAVDVNSYGYQL